jgi:hypothetical protein
MSDGERSPAELRERAKRCRRLIRGISDAATTQQLRLFADELEQQARLLEENTQAGRTHLSIMRQSLAELRHTSAQAKDVARRAREGLKKPVGDREGSGC